MNERIDDSSPVTCSRHNWRLVQNQCIYMQYHIWCCRCGIRSEPDILLGRWDKAALRRRLIRNARKCDNAANQARSDSK